MNSKVNFFAAPSKNQGFPWGVYFTDDAGVVDFICATVDEASALLIAEALNVMAKWGVSALTAEALH